jgi:hypothetical protein
VADVGVALVLVAGGQACRDAAAALFPGTPCEVLGRDELRPPAPFRGGLFSLLGALPRDSVAGLVVPAELPPASLGPAAETARPGPTQAVLRSGELAPIADHVDLRGRGPLTGVWPSGLPRDFPSMSGIYQPAFVRPLEGARVYSSGVVAAGVADARRLTRFEARAIREGGWPIVSDSLVPVAIVAAYYGLRLAACGLVRGGLHDRE